ncbi:MAG: hypothetical protein M0Z76_09205 [Gammaproteobacteria bacterium]|nr:hypothetical protein [Gammaproteobacteria bacterium]
MSILNKHLEFVNEQFIFHENRANTFDPKTFRAKLHLETANKFKALAADLESADKILDDNPPKRGAQKGQIQLSLTFDEVSGLPEELLQELNLSDADKTEFEIVKAIEDAGGIISLDRLLIALYKNTGEIHKRNSLYSRLARMASKSLLFYVPGKKGVYSATQLTADEAARLFGSVKEDEIP